MKYLKTFEEQSYYKPEFKRPINYKCLNLNEALYLLEKDYKLKSSPFWDWTSKVHEELNILLPNPEVWKLSYQKQSEEYKKYGMKATKIPFLEKDSIFELPMSYDSSKDEENYYQRQLKFMKDMKDMAIKRGKTWTKKDDDDLLQNVNFGSKSFDYINKYLSKIHELYGQHYKNGVIRCFVTDSDNKTGIFDYPVFDYEEKALFLSELEEWIESFELDTKGFYEWILRYNFVERRYWQRVWRYGFGENFRNEKPAENIKKINELLKQLYKNDLDFYDNPDGEIPIFFDYYKVIDENKVY